MSDDLIRNAALAPPGGITAAGVTVGGAAGHTGAGAAKQATAGAGASSAASTPSFQSLLAQAQSAAAPSFSKHALERLARRGVTLDQSSLSRLTDGISAAAQKGSRNSVVFVDGTAYVTSVQNNTVITAVTPEAMKSHVFTNIDSTVVA